MERNSRGPAEPTEVPNHLTLRVLIEVNQPMRPDGPCRVIVQQRRKWLGLTYYKKLTCRVIKLNLPPNVARRLGLSTDAIEELFRDAIE